MPDGLKIVVSSRTSDNVGTFTEFEFVDESDKPDPPDVVEPFARGALRDEAPLAGIITICSLMLASKIVDCPRQTFGKKPDAICRRQIAVAVKYFLAMEVRLQKREKTKGKLIVNTGKNGSAFVLFNIAYCKECFQAIQCIPCPGDKFIESFIESISLALPPLICAPSVVRCQRS